MRVSLTWTSSSVVQRVLLPPTDTWLTCNAAMQVLHALLLHASVPTADSEFDTAAVMAVTQRRGPTALCAADVAVATAVLLDLRVACQEGLTTDSCQSLRQEVARLLEYRDLQITRLLLNHQRHKTEMLTSAVAICAMQRSGTSVQVLARNYA
ncbi:hypothetical protein PHYPSEUDO_002325 [Phytophthora pseudosyringae]|uniref:Uncharacterized protein n=1 Tax=Phytophthora pseudosyringae TaxID=221518 RepID=A0A8T1WFZ3_9STRA|nr:hypothetical protein PHYPSEUDO_002325 [Phytophthora pseudosyringae]